MTHFRHPGVTIALLLAGALANAQTIRYVLSAASAGLPGLPNSPIAQGSLLAIYGSALGVSVGSVHDSFPLVTSLGGASAKVNIGGTDVDLFLTWDSDAQINAVLPSSTPVGTGTITVTYNGKSASAPITVVPNNFGIFTVGEQGSGMGVVVHSDYTLVTPNNAANPGETLIIEGTGLGPVQGDEAAGPLPGNLNVPVQVWVGTQQTTVSYRGRSAAAAGLDLVKFTVPPGIAGCTVSVAVQIGSMVSNFTDLAIAEQGAVCSDVGFSTGTELAALFNSGVLRYGGVTLVRTISEAAPFPGVPVETTKSDDGQGLFGKFTFWDYLWPTYLIDSSSYGSCSVTEYFGETPSVFAGLTYTSLDLGPAINISGPDGNRSMSPVSANGLTGYSAKLGAGTPGNYLDPGNYTISSTGGTDVGPFSVQIVVPPSITWTNEDQISNVTRASGQVVTWTGGDPNGYVDITGSSVLLNPDNSAVGASFACRAFTSAGSFTIPGFVLLSLPASANFGGFALPGVLGISSASLPKQFTATGLDLGYANSLVTDSKQVIYQ